MGGRLIWFYLLLDCALANVQFFLVTRENPKDAVELEDDFSGINVSNPVKFIVHGWGQSYKSPFYAEMTDAYLIRGEYNVIQVDWSAWAAVPYVQASQNTRKAGKQIGDFIHKLPVPLKNVHIIGHSLGAHVSGIAGKTVEQLTGDKIYRISGLDPAGPGFRAALEVYRLTNADAEMVDITHTDINYFGYTSTMGTVDFYPNGGHRPQPGCELYNPELLKLPPKQIPFCSHAKSFHYFIESINSDAMVGIECKSLVDFETGECNENNKIIYGENTPMNARGIYYFTTNVVNPISIKSLGSQFPLQFPF